MLAGIKAAETSKLDQAQRQMRLEENASTYMWEPLLFTSLQGTYPLFEKSGSVTGRALQREHTKGVWKVDAIFSDLLEIALHSASDYRLLYHTNRHLTTVVHLCYT